MDRQQFEEWCRKTEIGGDMEWQLSDEEIKNILPNAVAWFAEAQAVADAAGKKGYEVGQRETVKKIVQKANEMALDFETGEQQMTVIQLVLRLSEWLKEQGMEV